MSENVRILEGGRNDVAAAQTVRDELAPLLKAVCDIFDRAKAQGLIVSFNIATDQYGRTKVNDVSVVRPL